ncbi:MAG: hypothetical protein ACR2OR_08910 [Hyphomicrobiales bacterium]
MSDLARERFDRLLFEDVRGRFLDYLTLIWTGCAAIVWKAMRITIRQINIMGRLWL